MLSSFKRARICLFICMSFGALVFAGAVFGWGPMQLILEENGNYGHLCNATAPGNKGTETKTIATETTPCHHQSSSLLLVITVAQILIFTAPLWGALVDSRGPLFGIITMSFLVWTGLSFLTAVTFYPGASTDPLLYPAFICLIFAATLFNILSIHVGMAFDRPESTQLVISLY
mmetsp:Transcript_14958/g.35938  ORF Transcript_14958/g.35938 Transcript_14958/m.35938 type:complete len:174 (-) Transcript_14958:106-627(-)